MSRYLAVGSVATALTLGMYVLAGAAPLRDITDDDIAAWNTINEATLTSDGHWLAYLLESKELTAVLRSVHGDIERRYPLGQKNSGAGMLKVSASGKWTAFLSAHAGADTDLIVAENGTGKTMTFPGVKKFSFLGDRVEGISFESSVSGPSSQKYDLVVRVLDSGETFTLRDTEAYSFNSAGTRVAWADEHGLQVREFPSGRREVLDPEPGAVYSGLTWSGKGRALAAVRMAPNGEKSLLAFSHLHTAVPKKKVFTPSEWAGFPAGHAIETTGNPPQWREDEQGLFFSIRRLNREPDRSRITPNLSLWHWKDERLPLKKKLDDASANAYLCFVSLSVGRFVRLADDTLLGVEPHGRSSYVLGYDTSAYGWENRVVLTRGAQTRDYFLSDVRTGRRKLVVRNLQVGMDWYLVAQPMLSPDGKSILYQNNAGDYVAYNVEVRTTANLTANLPTKFQYEENRGRYQPRQREINIPVVQGWFKDTGAVLISDYYDVWSLSLDGKRAVNLTQNGRRDRIVYQLIDFNATGWPSDFGKYQVDSRRPLYFAATDLKTGHERLVKYDPKDGHLQVLRRELANLAYKKAAQAEVFIYTRQTSTDCPDYYVAEENWRTSRRLTAANPQQSELQWWPGARYLTYISPKGEELKAVLYPPIGYEAGKAYPTIVRIYEKATGTPTNYLGPNEVMFEWVRNGYAVLQPDIRPRFNESGPAALEGVTAGVNAAVNTGIVDPDKLGLMGFSHGAYETFYIVSQTSMFKAALAEAGLTNFLTQEELADGGSITSATTALSHQSYLKGSWWEYWDVHIKNSPLFQAQTINTPLLIAHGDRDQAVPFDHSVMLFNTLRKMGGKPVVMLQYGGDYHVLKKESKHDLSLRTREFFDHFLKEAEPPEWWSDGVSYYEGRAPKPQ